MLLFTAMTAPTSAPSGIRSICRMLALAVVAAAYALPSQAQQFNISTSPSISSCTGVLEDSGGPNGQYGNNQNFTSTICPDGGPAISLQWVVFNLSTAGVAPVDQISIYDGNSTSAPLIGTWTGTNGPGNVTASFANPTGCLTVVFTSNNTGTGDFAASISCFQPCEPPTAVATFGSAVPLLACQNETISFDASASFAAAGFSIAEYNWNFADGTTATGPVVEHAFSTPAEYMVQVEIVDDNGCSSTNLVDLQVLISTTPIFTGTTPSTTICQGESVVLNSAPTAVTWSALPESSLGDGIFLPDLQGVPFSTSITFTSFGPGQTLTNVNDLLSVCVDMEHSFMGDLVISMSCPNGQSVTFHQQGGGGTYLGIPVDNDATPNIQGVCWNYCWSPAATNGTWVQNSGGTLAAGTYQSLQPFSNLLGCPLNGTWTFTVVDLWASDNGFLCNWGLDFNPSLFPSLTEYTPVLGVNSSDSVSWSGTGFVANPNNPTSGVATPTQPGTFPYIFSVTDNFGCTYDTTIFITVTPSPQGPIVITGNPTFCEGGLAFLNAPPGFDSYVWSNGSTGPNISVNTPGTYTVTVGLGNCTLPSEPFPVALAPNPVPIIVGPQYNCGALVTLATSEPFASYQWSNGSTDPAISVGSGTYTVTVTTAQGCTGTSDPFDVLVGNIPTAAFTTDPVSPQNPGTDIDFIDQSNGNGSTITGWDWNFGYQGAGSNFQNPGFSYEIPGVYTITLIVTTAEGCTDTTYQAYVIRPDDIIIPNVFSPNGDGLNDFFVVENLQYYRNTVQIYNRWGGIVYEANNYQNNWRGLDLSDGTYYYLIRLSELDKEYAGHVTILR